MTKTMLLEVLELSLAGLPPLFEARHLDEQAHKLMQDFSILLNTKVLVKNSVLMHKFRLTVNEHQKVGVMLVVGLTLPNQLMLDYEYGSRSLGCLEQLILEDRQKMVTACRNLPTQSALTAIEFSQRIAEACLFLPIQDQCEDLANRLKTLLTVKRRRWNGIVADRPWQHQLPSIAKYDWRSELLTVRVQLQREKRGFSLMLMRPNLLPDLLQSVRKLRMLERPHDIDEASILDRAEFTRSSVNIVIRAGSRPGSDQLIVADFLRFPL